MRRLIAAALAGLVLAPVATAATKAPVFGLRAAGNPKRGYFVYSLPPGAVQQGAVIVSNAGTATGTVKLFVADATTGRTTGTVYLTDRKPRGAGAWITLSSSSLTLRPGQHRTVRFTVRVPSGAKTGQWVAGVVAETSHRVTGQKSKQKANVQIRIRDLTIVAVQVNIPGPPVTSFKVGGVTTGGTRGFQEVVTHMANEGNVLVKPSGTVTILDSSGATVQTLTFKMDTFLPHTAIDYPVLLKKALPPGDYTARVHVVVPGVSGAPTLTVRAAPAFTVSKQDVQQVFTSATPQKPPPGVSSSDNDSKLPFGIIAAAAAGGLAVLLLAMWLLGRRRRTPGRPQETFQRIPPAPPAPAAEEPHAEPGPLPSVSERTAPPPPPDPVAPPAAATPAPPSEPAPVGPSPCEQHLWEVAYERGELGADGVWRFPHRCRNCGLELLARDVADASAGAGAAAAQS
jgi:hypothetical protein